MGRGRGNGKGLVRSLFGDKTRNNQIEEIPVESGDAKTESPLAAAVKTGIVQDATIKTDWVAAWSMLNADDVTLPAGPGAAKILEDSLNNDDQGKIFSEWGVIASTQIIANTETGSEIIQRASNYDDPSTYGKDNGRLFRVVAETKAKVDSGLKNLDLNEEPDETEGWNIMNRHSQELIEIGETHYSVQEVYQDKNDGYIIKDNVTGEPIDRIWNLPESDALDFLTQELKRNNEGSYTVEKADTKTLKNLADKLEKEFPGKDIVIETGSIKESGVNFWFKVED